jgi:hypothetical protein
VVGVVVGVVVAALASLPDFSKESGFRQYQDMVTKWLYSLLTGLIFVATGTATRTPSL